jgi:hypothetical protein
MESHSAAFHITKRLSQAVSLVHRFDALLGNGEFVATHERVWRSRVPASSKPQRWTNRRFIYSFPSSTIDADRGLPYQLTHILPSRCRRTVSDNFRHIFLLRRLMCDRRRIFEVIFCEIFFVKIFFGRIFKLGSESSCDVSNCLRPDWEQNLKSSPKTYIFQK